MMKLFALALAALMATAAPAAALELTVYFQKDGVAQERSFSQDELEALGMDSLETATPWEANVIRFEGVWGSRLIEELGAEGEIVGALAVNDYAMELPIEDFTEGRAFIATRRDGERMTVASKGPFWIVYDFDAASDTDQALYLARAVWQLIELTVE